MAEDGNTAGRSLDRARGALLGLAVGDAVGTAVEFKPPGTFEPVTDMVGGGPFGLPAGAWTDDTSMALCLAESLIEGQGFDPVDQLERYVRWYREGHWSSTGRCFDIGNATRKALHHFERTHEPYPGDADPRAAGNGPLMKLAPVALAYASHPLDAVRYAAESARTTHGAPEAADACRYFAGLLVGALHGAGVSALLHQGPFEPAIGLWHQQPLHPKVAAVAAGSFHAKDPPAIRGGGYIVDALEAALWALSSTRTFEDGVLAAVNLGDDADSTAAIFGQLAGALYGLQGIPERWRERCATTSSRSPTASSSWPAQSMSAHRERVRPRAHRRPAVLPRHRARATAIGSSRADSWPGPIRVRRRRRRRRPSSTLSFACRSATSTFRPRGTCARFWERSAWPSKGETVYVHCWGGVGRTGTVVGCLLVEDGTSPTEVLARLAEMRVRTVRAHRLSPETPAQRTFVTEWEAPAETITLDQEALDRLRPESILEDPAPIPTLGEIVAKLRSGSPVVIEGPGPGWCIQAVADHDDHLVRVEVLDPEHWENGPPLPADQQDVLERLGLEREDGMWARTDADEDGAAVVTAATLMLDVVRHAWAVQPEGALGPDEVPPPNADWQRIAEFAHTFDGYVHFGEQWGDRFNSVRERYFETDQLPDDVDDLRACLFLEFRGDRFTWGDDVTLSEPDAEGVRHVVPNPDFEQSPTQRYRRAIIAKLRELLTHRTSS